MTTTGSEAEAKFLSILTEEGQSSTDCSAGAVRLPKTLSMEGIPSESAVDGGLQSDPRCKQTCNELESLFTRDGFAIRRSGGCGACTSRHGLVHGQLSCKQRAGIRTIRDCRSKLAGTGSLEFV